MGCVGECKPIVAGYLQCLRRAKGTNEEGCRMLAKEYLKCRMEQYVIPPFALSIALRFCEVCQGVRNGNRGYEIRLLMVFGDSNLMAPDELKNLGMLLRWDG